MKPRIYEPTEKDFSHNGLGLLSKATRCDVTEEANGKYEVEIEYPLKSRFAEFFVNGYQIKAKPNDQEDYHIFEIKNTYQDTFNNSILIYGQSRTYKLGNREVRHVEIASENGIGAMSKIEKGMDEPSDIKLYSDIQTVSSTLFEARNVLNCIAGEQGSMLQYWGGEIKREPFKLSLLARRGRDNVGTVRYGKDLNGLKIKFDWSSIITKVLPYADLQNGDDGTTNRIYGDDVYSELATNYPDVYAYHIQFTEDQGVTDLASLNRVASRYFKSINPDSDKPKVTIELEIEKLTDSEEAKEFSKIRNYGLFDTFSVYHKLYDIYIETRVTSIVYDSINEKNKVIYAGDARMAFYTKQNYELQEVIKTLTKKGYMSEFVDYITGLINGVEGGSVLQYPKNKPHSTYWMDTDSVDTSKDVMVHNNQGIGFSRTGWKGPFVYGWTIDGVLNASFIKAGVLNGVQVQAEDDNFLIDIYNGKIRFVDKKSGKEVGALAPVFGEGGLRGYSFIQVPGFEFNLSTQSKDGKSHGNVLQIPAESNAEKPMLNLYGDVNLSYGSLNVDGRVDVKELYVEGVKIDKNGGGTGGGGGGDWNGQYPPEVTTDMEKNAWRIWVYFINKGWNTHAIAGMLGNMESESWINPDQHEVGGGGGYGLVQWTPASKLIDWCNANGLDYKVLESQCQRIQYEADNNIQWFSNPSRPDLSYISFLEFTKLTDEKLAAEYFIAFYEHPANPNQPIRGQQATTWYNKFKDLKQPGGKYGYPVTVGTPITSWFGPRWGTMHNGIDFGGSIGDPIFAAQDGVVHMSLPTSGSGGFGEYVVIKHDDGYMTGYAHNSQRLVNVGDKVAKGQLIARMGNTGDSTGPHLHFSVQTGDWDGYVDPAPFLGLTPPQS